MPLSSPIRQAELLAALTGASPALGHSIDQAELGRRLAAHRQGRYPGRPYTQAAISLYLAHPEQQSADFAHAFRSWRLAETQRQNEIHLVADGMTVDEMLREANGRVVQLGDSPAVALLVIGQLPPGALIEAGDPVPHIVVNRAPIRQCACGARFVARSWNQRRCAPDCKG